MTKINSQTSDQIRSLWEAGYKPKHIREILRDGGLDVSIWTVNRYKVEVRPHKPRVPRKLTR